MAPTFQSGAQAWQVQVGLPMDVESSPRVRKLADLGRVSGRLNELLRPLRRAPWEGLIVAQAELMSFAYEMRPHTRLFGGIAFEFRGHRERIKERRSATEQANVYSLVGALTMRIGSVPGFPGHHTLQDHTDGALTAARTSGRQE